MQINPRADGVWQLTGPDEGGPKGSPLRISGTNSWIGKIQTAFERSHRGAPDLVPMNLAHLTCDVTEGQKGQVKGQNRHFSPYRLLRRD